MSLWNTPIDPNNSPLKDIEIDKSITPEMLEARLKEAQAKCEHDMQRFGPSYTARQDGSYKRFDESICLKCGYHP